MKNMSGAGVLVAHGKEINVLYDLVQRDTAQDAPLVGQIFGEADALQEAVYAPHSVLRLANGHAAEIVLQNCESRGVADVRITGPITWE
ncbi:MAG TPA: hypothetical protein VIJ94_14735 [Caulobacteraceae bacterium]